MYPFCYHLLRLPILPTPSLWHPLTYFSLYRVPISDFRVNGITRCVDLGVWLLSPA